MSDTSQGPGWWIASDGKWYPPDQKPGPAPVPPTAEPPAGAAPEPTGTEATPETPPPATPSPPTPPPASPGEPHPTEPVPVASPGGDAAPPVVPPPLAPSATSGKGCLKAVLIAGAILALLAIAAVAVLIFAVDRGVDTVNDKLDAQQKVEDRTGIKSNSFNSEHPPQDDLGDWTCTSSPNGFAMVTGSVKNNSSHTSSYVVTVDFKENDTEFDSAPGVIFSVDPGQTADFSATGTVKPTGQFTCRIDTIDRTDITPDLGN